MALAPSVLQPTILQSEKTHCTVGHMSVSRELMAHTHFFISTVYIWEFLTYSTYSTYTYSHTHTTAGTHSFFTLQVSLISQLVSTYSTESLETAECLVAMVTEVLKGDGGNNV